MVDNQVKEMYENFVQSSKGLGLQFDESKGDAYASTLSREEKVKMMKQCL